MRTALLPTAAAALALSAPAVAGLHKCVDADGAVTYRQTACPGGDAAQTIDAPPGGTPAGYARSRSPGAAACGAVRKLAHSAAEAMKRGGSGPEVIEALGGVGGIGQANLEIVNYVFSFDGQRLSTPTQIAALAVNKCEAGGFSLAAHEPTEPEPGARGGRSAGSGFVVNARGDVLTNHHFVDGCRTLRVQHGDRWYDATLTHSRASADLAVLHAEGVRAEPAVLSHAHEAQLGEQVVAAGYPLQTMLSRQVNVTSGVVSANAGLHEDPSRMQITAPVQPGNSGGPVLDESGQVKGVTVARLNDMNTMVRTGALPQNVNFAIKARIARAFLDDSGIAYRTAPPAADRYSPRGIAQEARRYTVFVDCYH